MKRIDLNCDMGESFGAWKMGRDEEIMPLISSANIACGFHAGDPGVMLQTVRLALRHDVAVGAHPGFPDLQGFGRRPMQLSENEIFAITLYQIGALKTIVESQGGRLRHVKPHGALYNMAAQNRPLAEALAEAVRTADPGLVFYGLSGSIMLDAAREKGLRCAAEVFADRSYQKNGSLTPRDRPGALINTREAAVRQALEMALNGRVAALGGEIIVLQADTLCLHGDGEHALEFARAIRQTLQEAGVTIEKCFA